MSLCFDNDSLHTWGHETLFFGQQIGSSFSHMLLRYFHFDLMVFGIAFFTCEHHLNECWSRFEWNMHYFLGNINTSDIKCVWLGFGGCLWILVHLTPELRLVRTKYSGVSVSANRRQLEVFVQNCAISNRNAFLCHPGAQKVRTLCFPSFQFELLLNQKLTQSGARRRPDPAASSFGPTSPPLFECLQPSTPIKKVVTLCLEICCLIAFPTQRHSYC